MLLTRNLIEGIEDEYKDMIAAVNIPNFTKAISCFANMSIKNLDEEVLKRYLYTWAKSKYKFWLMFGKKTRVDIPIEYKRPAYERSDIFIDLKREYPAFVPWIHSIESASANRFKRYELSRELIEWITRGWPDYKYEDASITKFFSNKLNAPADLVNKLAKVYENESIVATYTLSIDPVDMLFASETPYWNSCYRLNTIDYGDSHTDGAVAAMLDTSTIITYIWTDEGKYNFSSSSLKYEFKDIRYKKLRIWVSIEPTEMKSFYMAVIYPKKEEMGQEFEKMIRLEIERVIGRYIENYGAWHKIEESPVVRRWAYGYTEFTMRNRTFTLKDVQELEDWYVYDVQIPCPHCGDALPGSCTSCNSDECADEAYATYIYDDGFNCMGYREQYYCDLSDCDCDWECCEENCYNCEWWQRSHPICSITDSECDDVGFDYAEDGYVEACDGNCDGCWRWRDYKESLKEDFRGEDEE